MTLVQARVEDRRVRVADWMSLETIGSSVYSRMPFEAALGGGLVGGVDLVDRDRPSAGVTIVRSMIEPVGTGTRSAKPLELAVELGQHEADGLRGTGRGRERC